MTDDAERKRLEAEQLKQSNAEADADQRKRSIAAAVAYGEKKPAIEKRRRAQQQANTPEAIRARNDWAIFTGK